MTRATCTCGQRDCRCREPRDCNPPMDGYTPAARPSEEPAAAPWIETREAWVSFTDSRGHTFGFLDRRPTALLMWRAADAWWNDGHADFPSPTLETFRGLAAALAALEHRAPTDASA